MVLGNDRVLSWRVLKRKRLRWTDAKLENWNEKLRNLKNEFYILEFFSIEESCKFY